MLIYSSPWLIAVSHVLRRLLMPRHSPYALYSLNFHLVINPSLYQCFGFDYVWFSLSSLAKSIAWVSFDNFYHLDCFLFCVKRHLHFLHSCFLAFELFYHLSGKIVVIHDSSERPFCYWLILIFLKQFFSIICSFYSFALFGFQWTFAFAVFALIRLVFCAFLSFTLILISTHSLQHSLKLARINGDYCNFKPCTAQSLIIRPGAFPGGGLKWTRTIDLALIRRAL